jgi:hypothetical protein
MVLASRGAKSQGEFFFVANAPLSNCSGLAKKLYPTGVLAAFAPDPETSKRTTPD